MSIAGALIWAAVLLLAVYAARTQEGRLGFRGGMRLILWAGALGPSLLLGILLVASLPEMKTRPVTAESLRVAVDGEQFWWRVRYSTSGGGSVETANEIRVPVGRTAAFALSSPDVIHSFWIPGLAGKVDMIPGRTNDLVVRATKPGVYRGVCAEFCGLSHARMAFDVIAMEQPQFDAWLSSLSQPAAGAGSAGRQLFTDYGCAGCHSVRGQSPDSSIGPDLTHFADRRSLGAGTLPMTREAISSFIRDPSEAKPGTLMPAFRSMPAADADQIAAYLQGLR